MHQRWKKDIWFRILAVMVITILSGISPLPHRVRLAMLRIGQSTEGETSITTAQDLAMVATHLPWRRGLWEKTAHYALSAGDVELAIQAFKNAAAAGDLSLNGYLAFGDAYAEAGNPYTATQVWDAATAIFGPSKDALLRQAAVHRSLEANAPLIQILKALLQVHQMDLSPLAERAQTNLELGMLLAVENPDSASPYLLQAVELDPALVHAGALAFAIQRSLPHENPTYTLMAVGRELASQNRWDWAAKAFQKAAEIQPGYAESWAFLGEATQHLDGTAPESALPALEIALALEPESLSANIFMSLYWKRVGDPDQHYHYLTRAANIDPDNPAILIDLGEASAILGDLESGYQYHQQAISLSYQDPSYLNALVLYCIRYNYHLREIALPTARLAVMADRGNPATQDVMGQVLFRLGDLLNAQRFYQRALRIDSGYAPAYLHLGLVYSLRDQPEQAANAFAQAIALAPGTSTSSLAERLFDHLISP